ncbi:hypothetical protein [Parasitella parasitica]|uniref:Uncharacterized protein n=1 Tax=Parasitella parasitica TaxID=35722 RepID=A0A0B7NJ85_9FUNG|nr:hypothetical protein [Parasitella parasitica]
MWKHREKHILDIYKNDRLVIEQNLTRKPSSQHPSNETIKMYQGNEFDVFGKDPNEEQFAPLYSKEQFTPKNKEKMDKLKREILLRTDQKRGHMEALLQHTAVIKKRKVSPGTASTSNNVFFKSTAAINSPIASIFVDPKQDNQDEDMAYY